MPLSFISGISALQRRDGEKQVLESGVMLYVRYNQCCTQWNVIVLTVEDGLFVCSHNE